MHAVRGLFPLEQTPGVISLLAGKPNAALFPLTGVRLTTPRVDGPGAEDVELTVDDELLAMGLQYAPTSGIPPMVEWLTDFQEREHGRRRLEEGWRISVTAGSQDAIYKASLLLFAVPLGARLTLGVSRLYMPS
jgi:tryptophan aminotransferase